MDADFRTEGGADVRFFRWMISGYRRLTVYRQGEYERIFVREGLRNLLFVGLVFGIGMLLDMAGYVLMGNFGLVRLTAAWMLVALLLGGAAGASFILRRRTKNVRLMRMATRLIVIALLLGSLCLAYWEVRISGGLYVYSLTIMILGTMLNLPMREAAAYMILYDICIVFIHHNWGLHIWDDNFLNPDRYIIFTTVVAMGASMQRHISYLLRVRQRTSLRAIGETDPLTGLLNRRGMEAYVRQNLRPCEVCAALFDIDNFKLYNDTYGHDAGDACLRRVARLIQEMAKGRDAIAVRYGGEELLLLFFSAEVSEVRAVVEQGIQKLWNMKLSSGNGALQPFLSVSCGIAVGEVTLADQSEGLRRLIAAADAKLYTAKSDGKNRCVV